MVSVIVSFPHSVSVESPRITLVFFGLQFMTMLCICENCSVSFCINGINFFRIGFRTTKHTIISPECCPHRRYKWRSSPVPLASSYTGILFFCTNSSTIAAIFPNSSGCSRQSSTGITRWLLLAKKPRIGVPDFSAAKGYCALLRYLNRDSAPRIGRKFGDNFPIRTKASCTAFSLTRNSAA